MSEIPQVLAPGEATPFIFSGTAPEMSTTSVGGATGPYYHLDSGTVPHTLKYAGGRGDEQVVAFDEAGRLAKALCVGGR